ncbi:MAG: TonB-dependent receptor [Candidatus Marinimicrobia bacterium]|nr:TonB-dependent receptor [Candidatus Neomarinimicrobiota bacterium]
MTKTLIKYLLAFCLIPAVLSAAALRGVVTDADTGEPLVGVNVILRGTYYGAATAADGSYTISGMGPGTYDMVVSMIGYKQYIHGGIELDREESRRIDVALENTVLALGEDVVVFGEKPLIDATSTASSHFVSSEDLMGKIVESVSDIVGQQAGVSTSNNEIHIRGGRVDESQFIVDGLSIKDPLTGKTSSLYVNPNAIEELEIITGGFNAEYGQAMSGIIDVKLKEGARDFEGSFRYKSDQLFGDSGFSTDNIEFTLGGPVLKENSGFIPGNLSYFLSSYLYLSDTYLPGASRLYPYRDWMNIFTKRQENNFSSMAKLSWNYSQRYKLSLSYNHSANVNQGYFTGSSFPYAYREILDHYPTFTRESRVVNTVWTHTINSKLFYTVNLGYFFTNFHKAVQNKHWSEYEECLDLDPNEYTARDEFGNIVVYTGDEFWDHGDAPYWYDYWSRNYTLSNSFTYHPNTKHKVKAGFEYRSTEMQVVDIYKPWMGTEFGESYDFYKVRPSDGSFYVQDMITFEGMIVNVGMRYDYWFIGNYVTEAMHNPDILTITPAGRENFFEETQSFFGKRFKGHLSPRLGISHPVTDNDVLYFNYGHFSQLPTYNYVYAKLNTVSDNPYNLIGNPNLNPKTTVAYEIGVKHKFSASSAVEFKAYYKDMFDYETAQTITSFNPLVGNYSMMMYLNMDYARSRGVEVQFRQTAGRFFSGDASFTYSVTTGKSSNPDDNVLVEAGMIPEKPLSENYLSWDEPFRLIANLRFHFYEEEGPRFFINNWSLNAHIEAQAGRRYTEGVVLDTVTTADGTLWYIGTSRSDNPYGEIADPYLTVDLKFTKDFYYKDLTYGFYIDAKNVFNHKVPRRINPYTGEPYDPGEIISYSYYGARNPNRDPSRYYAPRQLMLGIFLRF